ncbi:MAG: hypothetical protein AAF074_12625 [Pseudomonadota bacterium]
MTHLRPAIRTVAAIAIAVAAMSGSAALASGGGADIEEQRAKLKAELAEARAAKGGKESGSNFFSRLFGLDDRETAAAENAKGARSTQ